MAYQSEVCPFYQAVQTSTPHASSPSGSPSFAATTEISNPEPACTTRHPEKVRKEKEPADTGTPKIIEKSDKAAAVETFLSPSTVTLVGANNLGFRVKP